MGYKHDQNYFSETYRPNATSEQRSQPEQPPSLPPRTHAASPIPFVQPPPTYLEAAQTYHSQPLTHSLASQDPRSSSTQSLVPAGSEDGRRKLLLIYVHGFLGDDDSFQSFPAHVHNVVAVSLVETHVVHTKIYPRYKSRKPIEHARNDLSEWLRPHESENTDTILFGHSMGGLLSAEVALLPSPLPSRAEGCNRRIIGTINFDCPFLGMHPGVVISGIGSIFRPAPETTTTLAPDASEQNLGLKLLPTPSDCTSSSLPGCSSTNISQSQSLNDSFFSENGASLTPVKSVDSGVLGTQQNPLSLASPSSDPCYNPPFPNDIRLPIRTGWENVLHFMNKHSKDLTSAARSLVTSHLEFGGCLADYKGLRSRYTRIRALENVEAHNKSRLRFLNYYTASTGRPKKEKAAQGSKPQGQNYHEELLESGNDQGSQQSALSTSRPCSPLQTQLILVEEHRDKGKNLDAPIPEDAVAEEDNRLLSEMDEVDLTALSSDSAIKSTTFGDSLSFSNVNTTSSAYRSFPPLPPPPECPPQFDPAAYTDKDIRNLAQKEYTRQNKTYIRALKDHEKAIQERRKLIEKKEKIERKEIEKSLKLEDKVKKLRDKEGPRPRNPSAARLPSPLNSGESSVLVGSKGDEDPAAEKPLRDKKFCMLPSKVNNQPDPCWVRVFMKGVDEVGAHCGLFVTGEHYEWLVNDVGKRVQEWVHDSEARR